MNSTAQARRGALYVILAALGWSTMGPLARLLNAFGLYALEVSQVRLVSAFLTTGVFLLLRDRSLLRIRLRDLWCFLGTGLCSLLLYCIFYFRAVERVSISVATVLTYMSPIYIMLLGALLFHEKITPRKLLALILSIGGCVLGCDRHSALRAACRHPAVPAVRRGHLLFSVSVLLHGAAADRAVTRVYP